MRPNWRNRDFFFFQFEYLGDVIAVFKKNSQGLQVWKRKLHLFNMTPESKIRKNHRNLQREGLPLNIKQEFSNRKKWSCSKKISSPKAGTFHVSKGATASWKRCNNVSVGICRPAWLQLSLASTLRFYETVKGLGDWGFITMKRTEVLK